MSENDILRDHNYVPCDSILDLSRFILPDSCFADINHLNYKGAKIFSEYLNNLIHSNEKDSAKDETDDSGEAE
jgi:hypothetical protein